MRRHFANTKMTLIEHKQLANSLSGGVTGVAWGFSSNTYVILQWRREEGVRQQDLEETDEGRERAVSTLLMTFPSCLSPRLLFALIPSCLSLSIPLTPPSLPHRVAGPLLSRTPPWCG